MESQLKPTKVLCKVCTQVYHDPAFEACFKCNMVACDRCEALRPGQKINWHNRKWDMCFVCAELSGLVELKQPELSIGGVKK